MLLLDLAAVVAFVQRERVAVTTVLCVAALIGPWMLAAYAGALAVLIRFAIGLPRE